MSLPFKQNIISLKTFGLSIKFPLHRSNSRCFQIYSVLNKEDTQDTLNRKPPQIKPFSKNEDHTWVGPPHPVSNLRLKVFPSSKQLTKEETHFYEKSNEIQEWSQQYWESHNKEFEKSKKTYMEKISKEKKSDDSSVSVEEMADFYKEFLDKNYKKHVSYNWQWYKRNFELLYLSAKAEISRLRKRIKKEN